MAQDYTNESEAQTRTRVDSQLRAAGWEVDSTRRRYSAGARPSLGKNCAIAEWPTASGPADYVLFCGLTPLAAVEAKRHHVDVAGKVGQAERYSADIDLRDLVPATNAPWGKYKIPFVYATNGRPYSRSLLDKSGVHFRDVRAATNHKRALEGWHSPTVLLDMLGRDTSAADKKLAKTRVEFPGIRDYQVRAIQKIERTIANGAQAALVAMATGTGKTRTCLSLLFRFVQTERFRRILFVVDREALGEQAHDTFKEVQLDELRPFTEIYDVKTINDVLPATDTRVQIATIQGLVRRVLTPTEGAASLPIDLYDCIVVDECHRGYTLDRELSEDERLFRDEADFISKYRRVLDHFDAVKIGLTATPALHTTEIFGPPIFTYSYREAVLEGWLVDHEPPIRLYTDLSVNGIIWPKGSDVKVVNESTGTIDLTTAPDELEFDVDEFNRQVITENFNRAIAVRLAQDIAPASPEKTIVFCVDNTHADLFIRVFSESLIARYGPIDAETVVKITSAVDDPMKLVRRFKNEGLPQVAVTVDLLTTGIDVPEVCNLVFIRRVRSRLLYHQMLGRGTRLCPNLYASHLDKECFRIFDAVNVYSALEEVSDMKPVVVDPSITFESLVEHLLARTHATASPAIHAEIVAKLQRKRRALEAIANEIQVMTGLPPAELIDQIRSSGPVGAMQLFRKHPALASWLDRSRSATRGPQLVSDHPDQLHHEERGYGKDGSAARPEDYLDAFGQWLADNKNKLPALIAVTTRPRDLTREQLKELKQALDAAGYSETSLKTAWRELKNEDIAASILGYVRQRALGESLRPYAERVDRALARIEKSRPWTKPQRDWLRRIANQIKREEVVDRTSLDAGIFEEAGGFARLDKLFEGRLNDTLGDFRDAMWQDTA